MSQPVEGPTLKIITSMSLSEFVMSFNEKLEPYTDLIPCLSHQNI